MNRINLIIKRLMALSLIAPVFVVQACAKDTNSIVERLVNEIPAIVQIGVM